MRSARAIASSASRVGRGPGGSSSTDRIRSGESTIAVSPHTREPSCIVAHKPTRASVEGTTRPRMARTSLAISIARSKSPCA